MKYIILCGGVYDKWKEPKHLTKINGETIVERTIRLLRENGALDIAISSNDPRFEQFGVPVLRHDNPYHLPKDSDAKTPWLDAFYPMETPVCYIFGDVVFSPEAIKTIVERRRTPSSSSHPRNRSRLFTRSTGRSRSPSRSKTRLNFSRRSRRRKSSRSREHTGGSPYHGNYGRPSREPRPGRSFTPTTR